MAICAVNQGRRASRCSALAPGFHIARLWRFHIARLWRFHIARLGAFILRALGAFISRAFGAFIFRALGADVSEFLCKAAPNALMRDAM